MPETRLASIIIDNYNYGRFLKSAIDSALAQTYRPIEVIVVDDGSTDNSRDIIAAYGDRVIPVLKENGGQGSAFNAGYAASHGEVVIFLDADDMLLSTAMESAIPFFEDPAVVKVHWPLMLTDAHGEPSGKLFPGPRLPDGDFRETLLRVGPANMLSAPSSGNAWSRPFLDQAFPLDEVLFNNGCDTYLFELAPFYGIIRAISAALTLYRQHGLNDHSHLQAEYRFLRELRFYDRYVADLERYCKQREVTIDRNTWRKNSWWHKLADAIQEVKALPDPQAPLILVDDGTTEIGALSGRKALPFPEWEGVQNGCPEDDEAAIQELHRLMDKESPALIVFLWPSFWWLDHYGRFAQFLRDHFPCFQSNERLVVFDLRQRDRRPEELLTAETAL